MIMKFAIDLLLIWIQWKNLTLDLTIIGLHFTLILFSVFDKKSEYTKIVHCSLILQLENIERK